MHFFGLGSLGFKVYIGFRALYLYNLPRSYLGYQTSCLASSTKLGTLQKAVGLEA